jgi:TRAP-type C4-dicarboxylate transport system permease small subunit
MPLPSLSRVSDVLNHVVTAVCVGCVLVMLGISFIGVFYTIITGGALSWTYSLARLFIPWIGLLSITVAFKGGEHIAMTSLLEVMPTPVSTVLRGVIRAVLIVFAGLMMWYGWRYLVGSTDYYMVSDQIQIHARWVAASIPITGLVLLVHALTGSKVVEASPGLGAPEIKAAGLSTRMPASPPTRVSGRAD